MFHFFKPKPFPTKFRLSAKLIFGYKIYMKNDTKNSKKIVENQSKKTSKESTLNDDFSSLDLSKFKKNKESDK